MSNLINETNGSPYNYPEMPSEIKLREYQEEAYNKWKNNGYQGIFEMATGTGKTITALACVSKLWRLREKLCVIIICPFIHLVDQWVKDIKLFNMEPIVCYGGRQNWEQETITAISAFNSQVIDHMCLIMTNTTFMSKSMQKQLLKIRKDILFIADEAHYLGADKLHKKLLPVCQYKLGLTATPIRHLDEEGTEELLSYFNGIVYEFPLKKAIGKFLTEYYYYPSIVYLTDEETERYYSLTRKISRFFFNEKRTKEEEENLKMLLIKRAKIISNAIEKVSTLEHLISRQKEKGRLRHTIVYCGSGEVEGERYIDNVIRMLGQKQQLRVHSFTARESAEKRRELLQRFEKGDLQALVAIKCLDEGVNVPAIETAYIVSSTSNPKEFIQRRGRVLRKYPGKEFAYIFDFFVLPGKIDEIKYLEPELFNIERNLIKNELRRLTEFSQTAINGPQAYEKLLPVIKQYHLLDM